MSVMDEISALLEEKKALFEQYEELTRQMQICPAEELPSYTDKRGHLAQKIDKMDEKIYSLAQAQGEEWAANFENAIRLKCRRSQLPEEFHPLFDTAQVFFGIGNRIREKELMIVERMEEELEALTKQIKANNRSVSAQASKFGVGMSRPNSSYLNPKYSKV